MLKIRQEQIDAFIEARIRDFVHELCIRLRAEMAEECRNVADLNEFAASGVTRAKHYQIHSEGAVEGFIRIQLSLGADFDTDPRYPWAEEILRSGIAVDAVKVWLLSQSAGRVRAERPKA